jgi:hypothetical protein
MPPSGGATKDENYSPPREACRGGLSRTGGPTPKANAFFPSQEGVFKGASIVYTLDTFLMIDRETGRWTEEGF